MRERKIKREIHINCEVGGQREGERENAEERKRESIQKSNLGGESGERKTMIEFDQEEKNVSESKREGSQKRGGKRARLRARRRELTRKGKVREC